MELVYDYRQVWSGHPWVRTYAALVVAILALAVTGTVLRDVLAVLFVPALLGAYIHHVLVQRRLK